MQFSHLIALIAASTTVLAQSPSFGNTSFVKTVIIGQDRTTITSSPTPKPSIPSTSQSSNTNTTTVTAVYLVSNTTTPQTVTYIYSDDVCSCHRTSSCAASDLPTSTAMWATTSSYIDDSCGCTTTVTGSCAPTVVPLVSTSAVSAVMSTTWVSAASVPVVVSAASTTAASLAVSPSMYHGGARQLAGSGVGVVAFVAALIV